jgi:3-carboxy-cis,cis-muconate cycloisomerase
MTSVTDSIIFRHIFSTAESSAIWSDTTRTHYYLLFEASLARAQAKLGIIPHRAADEIIQKCQVELIDMEELARETERIGYPVLGVVKQVVRMVNGIEPGLGEWTHWGATTQDVTDTATILQLRDTLTLISTSLDGIITALRVLCQTHISTPLAARSNLQQAVPITLGFKLARLLSTFHRHQTRLSQLLPRLLVLEFSGAAGTLATLTPNGTEKALACQSVLAEILGLGVPEIAWHTERDRIAELGGFLALITSTCSKFALDVKLMMQTEVGELAEPYYPHRGSSSTMPQKRNPISCVYITAMNATVRSLSGALYEGMSGNDHERSTGHWEVEWIALSQICCLSCATLEQTRKLVEGLEVRPDAMARNLELTKGGIVSEAVMMGLGPVLGRQYAHDLVYDVCRKANEQGRDLVDLLQENDQVQKAGISKEQLAKLCDPTQYLGLSVEMTERVLKMTA